MLRRRPAPHPVLPAHRWSGQSRLRRFWNALRWWLATALLVAALWYWFGATRIAPMRIPEGPQEVLTGPFTRCGSGRALTCAVDGDTIMVGQRAIRVIGIDAPEIHPARCPDEAQKGEAAAQLLLTLLNQGPVTLAGPAPPVHDEYGRELRHLLRAKADGSVQSLADDMVSSGLARPYLRGARDPWC
ncbi:MAG: thermonuclease family protein [Novosphingobium sp.]|uniref:thermonuclease family protein n=1 Tax=Novosphingobium sp. TaxID=1874826 RepID=UPI003C7AFBAD